MLKGIDASPSLSSQLLATIQRRTPNSFTSVADRAQPTKTRTETDVKLSFESRFLSTQEPQPKGDWRKTVGANGILLELATQIEAEGSDAELLKLMPNTDDESRLELAKQASDYAVSGQNNPFVNISRKMLSNIGYDESGAFTPAERYAAHVEISLRDGEFSSKASALVEQAQINGDDKAAIGIVLTASLQRFAGMGETEKSMYASTEDSLKEQLKALGDTTIPVVNYNNVSDKPQQVLGATTDSKGKAVWQTFSLNMLEFKIESLELVSTFDDRVSSSLNEKLHIGGWLTVYTQIKQYSEQ